MSVLVLLFSFSWWDGGMTISISWFLFSALRLFLCDFYCFDLSIFDGLNCIRHVPLVLRCVFPFVNFNLLAKIIFFSRLRLILFLCLPRVFLPIVAFRTTNKKSPGSQAANCHSVGSETAPTWSGIRRANESKSAATTGATATE